MELIYQPKPATDSKAAGKADQPFLLLHLKLGSDKNMPMPEPVIISPYTGKVRVTRFNVTGCQKTLIDVACETRLKVFLDGHQVGSTLCSPQDFEQLAAGMLVSEGLINSPGDIGPISADEERGCVYVKSVDSCTGPGFSQDSLSTVKISPVRILDLMDDFLGLSTTYKNTRAVHSAAFCNPEQIISFKDDIGRHNALDKVLGECFLKGVPLSQGIILTSGRISSEILLKVARCNITMVISKAPPTDKGIMLADMNGITLAQTNSEEEIVVYSHPERIRA